MRGALQEAQNYIRTITVAQLRQSKLGGAALQDLRQDGSLFQEGEVISPQIPFDCQESATPFAHPVFWGAWICQGLTA